MTGDESWCCEFGPETKRHGIAWDKFSPAEESLAAQISCQDNADLFLPFFSLDASCIVHHEFVPEGTTVNSSYYSGVVERLYAHLRRVQNSSWLFLYDNASAHCALNVEQFLTSRSIHVTHQSPTRLSGRRLSLPEVENGFERRGFKRHTTRCDKAMERGLIAEVPARCRGPV